MKQRNLIFALLPFYFLSKTMSAQMAPAIEWQKCLGGSNVDHAQAIQQTTDGGYIVTGFSTSNNYDVTGNHGVQDFWVSKLDSIGNITWQRSYGGTGDDEATAIKQTSDGGYIVVGNSNSNNGDVSGNHGGYDYWVVKLNSIGELEWQKSYGGTGNDYGTSVQQTVDGKFIIAGYSAPNGVSDYLIIKVDENGNSLWQQIFGGTGDDRPFSIEQTADQGFIIAGNTSSNDGNVSGNHGNQDFWIIKLNYDGSLSWQKCFGGTNADVSLALTQSSDGGYFICGYTMSNDGNVSGNHGDFDYWVIKIDGNSELQWQKCFGGTSTDIAFAINKTSSGGCVVTGESWSTDGNVNGYHGNNDFWVVNLDNQGDTIWTHCYGGSWDEGAWAIQQTIDGGFIIAGYSNSLDGDVTGNYLSEDYWVIKLKGNDIGTSQNDFEVSKQLIKVYPNPSKSSLLINLDSEKDDYEIRICDLTGKMVFHQCLKHNRTNVIDIRNLNLGCYELQIINNSKGQIKVLEFVKN